MGEKGKYDLEERTFDFAKKAIAYIKKLPKDLTNIELAKQLTRSATSPGANYIEANESLGKKDFLMHIKISKKESKESIYWLKLSEPVESEQKEKEYLIKEATEIMSIFGAILRNSK